MLCKTQGRKLIPKMGLKLYQRECFMNYNKIVKVYALIKNAQIKD